MTLGSDLGANLSQSSLEEELDPQTTEGNSTLSVGKNASLTLGNESLIVVGKYMQKLANCT